MKKVLTEKEAREKVARLEEEYGVKLTETQKNKAIKSYMGTRKWLN